MHYIIQCELYVTSILSRLKYIKFGPDPTNIYTETANCSFAAILIRTPTTMTQNQGHQSLYGTVTYSSIANDLKDLTILMHIVSMREREIDRALSRSDRWTDSQHCTIRQVDRHPSLHDRTGGQTPISHCTIRQVDRHPSLHDRTGGQTPIIARSDRWTDTQSLHDLSLIHISEPTRPP